MSRLSPINDTLVLEVSLRNYLDRVESGEIRLGVSNQFKPTVYRDALRNLTPESLEIACKDIRPEIPIENLINELAHRLSDFTPPEIDTAWVD